MNPPPSKQTSFDLSFDLMFPTFPPFDADSYPNHNSASHDESPLNLTNPPLLGPISFDLMDSLPVDDTEATFPSLHADSYPCPNSSISPFNYCESDLISDESIVSETQLSIVPETELTVVPETELTVFPETQLTVVPETQLSPIDDSFSEGSNFEVGSGSVQNVPLPIEFEARLYIHMLRLMACFFPKWIGKDAIDSPLYPAPPEIREFLQTAAANEANKKVVHDSAGSSLPVKI